MNVEIATETPIFLFWEYLFRNFGILSLQCIGLPFYCSFIREVAYHLDAHMRQVQNLCSGQFFSFLLLSGSRAMLLTSPFPLPSPLNPPKKLPILPLATRGKIGNKGENWPAAWMPTIWTILSLHVSRRLGTVQKVIANFSAGILFIRPTFGEWRAWQWEYFSKYFRIWSFCSSGEIVLKTKEKLKKKQKSHQLFSHFNVAVYYLLWIVVYT